MSSSSIAITPALYKKLDFDVQRDFVPVTLIASQPSILVVHSSVSAANVQELTALSRTNRLAYASAGVGSATHLGSELLLYTARAQMLHQQRGVMRDASAEWVCRANHCDLHITWNL